MTGQMTLGELLAEGGTRAVGRNFPEWGERARGAIEQLAAEGMEFSADAIYALAGPPPHPNAVGAAFGSAARDGLIEFIRYGVASRASRHGGVQRIWRGTTNPRPGTGGTSKDPRRRTHEQF